MTEETLFHEALARSNPDERRAFLDAACAGRPEARAAVDALLSAHEATGGLLDVGTEAPGFTADRSAPEPGGTAAFTAATRPPADADPAGLGAGDVVAGRYTLVERLGEGGMGEVWVARQTEPVKRRVALKLIKPGMDSRAVLARFEQERQALALMDHPNIARVLDGGLAPNGRPFFVMELVNGLPLTRFCDEARLTPRARLELFVPICQAVQHAHQKGVVHRDLKPANILVTVVDGRPVPKVIDFGVAKATAGKLTDASLSTQFGAVVGTLEYMAPEQAGFSGADVDTRADVYSLGVILYELLTGHRPLDATRLRQAALGEMIRMIREEDPPKPSTRLSTDEALPSLAALRQTDPRRLTALLRGDLDWVVMKCLEKARDRRYETANGLARDVERFLAGDPVEAGPPSAAYRFRKLAAKHRTALATAAAFAGLLAAAAAVSTWQAVRATRAERRARVEADKAQAVNDFLTEDLLAQAEPEKNAVEDHVTLLEVLDRAAERVGRRFRDRPDVEAAVRATVARTYQGLASWDRAEAQWRALRDLAGRPGAEPHLAYLVDSELVNVRLRQDRAGPDLLRTARAAVEGLERTLGPLDRRTIRALAHLAEVSNTVHYGSRPDEDGRPSAEPTGLRDEGGPGLVHEVWRRSVQAFGPDHPDTLRAQSRLAEFYSGANRAGEALELLKDAVTRSEAALGPDHLQTLLTRAALGRVYVYLSRPRDAIPLLEDFLRRGVPVVGERHDEALDSRVQLGIAYAGVGRADEAVALLERVLRAQEAAYGPRDLRTERTRGALGLAHVDAGNDAEAVPRLESAAGRWGWSSPWGAKLQDQLLRCYRRLGRFDDVIPVLDRYYAQEVNRLGPDHPELVPLRGTLVAAYHEAGRDAAVVPLLREALARAGSDENAATVAARTLAKALDGAGRPEEALPLFRRALSFKQKSQGPASTEALEVATELALATTHAGRPDEGERQLRDLWARLRDLPPAYDSLRVRVGYHLGGALLDRSAWAEAEAVLRPALAACERQTSDEWNPWLVRVRLGAALLGQNKLAEAGPIVRAAYDTLRLRERGTPVPLRPRYLDTLETLARLSEATGQPAEAARYRREGDAARAAWAATAARVPGPSPEPTPPSQPRPADGKRRAANASTNEAGAYFPNLRFATPKNGDAAAIPATGRP